MSDRKSRMTLTAWAHVAEIVAAVGVITGLVFLTLQVKENTDITRASTYDRSIDRLNAWRANLVRDPEISRLYLAYSDATTEELTPEDQFRLQVLLTSLFRVQICNHRGLNLAEWNHIVAPRISSRFLTYIEDSCG